jgi:hypothetical protein
LKFEWTKNSVKAKDAEFVELACQRQQTSQAAAKTPPHGMTKARRARRSVEGRPPFPMAALVAIALERRDQRNPSNKAVATELRRIYKERHPGPQPAHRIVYDHVSEIYRQAWEGGTTLNP